MWYDFVKNPYYLLLYASLCVIYSSSSPHAPLYCTTCHLAHSLWYHTTHTRQCVGRLSGVHSLTSPQPEQSQLALCVYAIEASLVISYIQS